MFSRQSWATLRELTEVRRYIPEQVMRQRFVLISKMVGIRIYIVGRDYICLKLTRSLTLLIGMEFAEPVQVHPGLPLGAFKGLAANESLIMSNNEVMAHTSTDQDPL